MNPFLISEKSSSPIISLYFGDAAAPIFGCFHDTADSNLDLGVVICSPFGREELSAHRSMRALAKQLASQGLPVLRFDYPGCGDSAGSDENPRLVASWVASVHQAVDELKRLSGVSNVTIVGLRIGATIGATAAISRSDIVAFASIEGVVNGKNFVRELKAMQARWISGDTVASDIVEAGGFVIHPGTRDDLYALDLLRHEKPPAQQVLIINRDDISANERWPERLASLGAHVQTHRPPGYPEMMLDPQKSVVATAIIDEVSNWLRAISTGHPSTSRQRQAPRSEARWSSVIERPVSFTAHTAHLCGVLSLPDDGSTPQDAILILNAGATRRIGPNRMHVALARHWASQGHAVLRLDLSGLGDSEPSSGAPANVVYSPTAVTEAAAAAEYLLKLVKAQRCHGVGLCAGAYHSMKAALRGAPFNDVVLLNPLVFFWHDGMSIEAPGADSEVASTVARYKEGLFSVQRWKKLLRGQINVLRVLGVLSKSLRAQLQHQLRDVARSLHLPIKDDLARDIQTLVDRGVTLRFVLSQKDPSNELLRAQGGRRVRKLISDGEISVHIVPGADHTFSRKAPRSVAMSLLYGMFTPVTAAGKPAAARVKSSNSPRQEVSPSR